MTDDYSQTMPPEPINLPDIDLSSSQVLYAQCDDEELVILNRHGMESLYNIDCIFIVEGKDETIGTINDDQIFNPMISNPAINDDILNLRNNKFKILYSIISNNDMTRSLYSEDFVKYPADLKPAYLSTIQAKSQAINIPSGYIEQIRINLHYIPKEVMSLLDAGEAFLIIGSGTYFQRIRYLRSGDDSWYVEERINGA